MWQSPSVCAFPAVTHSSPLLPSVLPSLSFQGIYFAAKSGRMCAEAIVAGSENGTRLINEADLRVYLDKWDRQYWATYKVRRCVLTMLWSRNMREVVAHLMLLCQKGPPVPSRLQGTAPST